MSKRILIVDDSSMMRKLITRVLVGQGHQIVGEAKNGTEAFALYERLKPDLVTMDITMVNMDGLAAAQEILDHDPQARILFLSNRDEEKFRDRVGQMGAIGLVNKHHTDALLALVNKIPD
jgi:two-component system, chemotaxis family, chemotaxis protein CheY